MRNVSLSLWRGGPEIRVPVDPCWINQAYRALSKCSSSASFREFRFNPARVLMLSVNFRINLVFVLPYVRDLLLTDAKFLSSNCSFLSFIQTLNNYLLILIDRTVRFRFIGLGLRSIARVIPHMEGTSWAWNFLSNKRIEPIRYQYQLNASE